jgi:NADH:ubiquinone oxidoreductase subunit F (NADH-binding)
MGTARSPGNIIATVVGAVTRPGVHEVEMGTPYADLLDRCGGPRPGRSYKAALSGVSNNVIRAADFDVPLTYEDFAARRTGLGAAGFVVYDDTTDMTAVARAMSRFLATESCGQCPACKNGALEITARLDTIAAGKGSDSDFAILDARLRSVTDANRCYLGTEEQLVVSSLLQAFPEDFAARVESPGDPPPAVAVPVIADITDAGEVVFGS